MRRAGAARNPGPSDIGPSDRRIGPGRGSEGSARPGHEYHGPLGHDYGHSGGHSHGHGYHGYYYCPTFYVQYYPFYGSYYHHHIGLGFYLFYGFLYHGFYDYYYPQIYGVPYSRVTYNNYYYPDDYEETAVDGGEQEVVYEGEGSTQRFPRPADDEDGLDSRERTSAQFLDLGDAAFRAGRYGEAVDHYSKAVAFSPSNGVLFLVLSDALLATGDYHYGSYTLRRAIELDPTLLDADIDKRDFYGDPTHFDRQVAVLEAYAADRPGDTDAILMLAVNYLFGGRAADAVALLEGDRAQALRSNYVAQQIMEAARRR